jgi:hypothetical protein
LFFIWVGCGVKLSKVSGDNLCKLGFIKVWDKKEEGIVLRESIYSDIEQMLEV